MKEEMHENQYENGESISVVVNGSVSTSGVCHRAYRKRNGINNERR
jgi:ribosomal protein L21E